MPRLREIAVGALGLRPARREPPHNEYEALMGAAGSEDEWTTERRLEVRERINDALDQLTERERWIFDAWVVERLGLRTIAADLSLSKTHVHRLKDAACARLRALLEDDPTIKEFLNR